MMQETADLLKRDLLREYERQLSRLVADDLVHEIAGLRDRALIVARLTEVCDEIQKGMREYLLRVAVEYGSPVAGEAELRAFLDKLMQWPTIQ